MRNPVLLVMSLLAALNAALGLGVLNELISATTLGWLLVAQAAVTAGIQFWVRGEVTPMVDPRSYDGRQLFPKGVSDAQ